MWEMYKKIGVHDARYVVLDDGKRLPHDPASIWISTPTSTTRWRSRRRRQSQIARLDRIISRKHPKAARLHVWEEFRNWLTREPDGSDIFANTNEGTVAEIEKALRLQRAFQQVLDNPDAAEALQHPALKPLLEEAAG
jgi:hypothetical protein